MGTFGHVLRAAAVVLLLTSCAVEAAPEPLSGHASGVAGSTSTPDRSTPGAVVPDAVVAMPDVVCLDLQLAQDTTQAAGVFMSWSRDATGAGRAQLWDRNWTVVAQHPAPGAPVEEGTAILDVVRDDEPSPCPGLANSGS